MITHRLPTAPAWNPLPALAWTLLLYVAAYAALQVMFGSADPAPADPCAPDDRACWEYVIHAHTQEG